MIRSQRESVAKSVVDGRHRKNADNPIKCRIAYGGKIVRHDHRASQKPRRSTFFSIWTRKYTAGMGGTKRLAGDHGNDNL